MALDKKKAGFGFNLEEKFNKVNSTITPTDTDTQEITPTPTYTPAHVANKKAKERKNERLQLVVRPSTKARLAQYAEDHETSSSEVVQRLLDKLLNDSGY